MSTQITKLIPSGGVVADRTATIRLSWRVTPIPTDGMTQEVWWRIQDTTTWNVISVVLSAIHVDVAPNTFPEGIIEWQVRLNNEDGSNHATSDTVVFIASVNPPAPVITQPTGTVNGSLVTVEWTSEGQAGFHLELVEAGQVIWQYENTDDVSQAYSISGLENHKEYDIRLAIVNSLGLWSDYSAITIDVDYVPPAPAEITTTTQETTITLDFSHPTPTGEIPPVVSVDVYRRVEGDWELIGIDVGDTFVDYTPASGVVYEYRVRAYGDMDTFSDSFTSAQVQFRGVWLHEVFYPNTLHHFRMDRVGRVDTWKPTGKLLPFAGRKLPVAEFDITEENSVSVTLEMFRGEDDYRFLQQLIRSKNVLCYRDGRGRKLFGHVFELPISDEKHGNTTNITIHEISFTEELA
ncbi:hypothetical protein ACQCT5_10500 [Sutcliffiella halmapala]